ncbi:MAG TPA: iron-containing alcohol dehydrogenase, partial [Armatimonadota bacterium]|nr:iron-containing alcohol dehydrogenase [Armatimonadota bacterium]
MIEAFSVARIPEIIFGEGKFSELPAIMAQYGRQLLVFVGHRPLQSLPYWDRFTEMMSTAGFTWDVIQVEGEPSPDLVDDVVREYRQMGIDAVLAIGGGSVIDAAKAVAGLLPHGNSVIDHLEGVGRGIPYKGPAAPF